MSIDNEMNFLFDLLGLDEEIKGEMSHEDIAELETEHYSIMIPAMLRSERMKAGLSQEEVAQRLKISIQYVLKLEKTGIPSIKMMIAYLNVVGARLTMGTKHDGETSFDISYKTLWEIKNERKKKSST